MPVIGTYNGLSIVEMPASPSFREVNLKKHNSNAVLSSPFTGQVQTQSWPGADWWYGEISLPQLSAPDARAWSAFFSSCRGMLNVFPCGHPGFIRPSGTLSGTTGLPVVSGLNPAMSYALNIRGLKANVRRVLLPGDLIQLNPVLGDGNEGVCRLHEVVDPVNADASGNATIDLWPSLREAVTDGTLLSFSRAKGLFRLATNDTSALMTQTRLTGMSFTIIEAR